MKYMQKTPTVFVSLFEATPEHAHFESPILSSRMRVLGTALVEAHLGVIARTGPRAIMTVFAALSGVGASAIALSPASSLEEHWQAFRLLVPQVPIVFTGRGALGADITALASSSAALIIGSYPDALESILDHVKDTEHPIAVLTDEDPAAIHERVRARNPRLVATLIVSHDPALIVRTLSNELRRRSLQKRHSL